MSEQKPPGCRMIMNDGKPCGFPESASRHSYHRGREGKHPFWPIPKKVAEKYCTHPRGERLICGFKLPCPRHPPTKHPIEPAPTTVCPDTRCGHSMGIHSMDGYCFECGNYDEPRQCAEARSMTDAELDGIIEAGTKRVDQMETHKQPVVMLWPLAADLVRAACELRELRATSRDGAL